MYEKIARSRFDNSGATVLPLQFVVSPLADDRFAGRDDIDIAFRDSRVQSAAAELSGKIDRLRSLIGYRSCMSMGVRAVLADQADDGSISADAVAHRLRQFSEQIDEQLVCAREDIAEHEAASRTRMARHQPVRQAVSNALTRLSNEWKHLNTRDDALRRGAKIGLSGEVRYSQLKALGYSDEDIGRLRVPEDFGSQVAAIRLRMQQIGPQLEALKLFAESVDYDATAIKDIDPDIDAAVAARDGALPAVTA